MSDHEADAPSRPLVLVVARARNGVIGKDGALPWRIPEDLKHFRRVTTGHTIVMGRKTFESIGRPLPERRSIVVSRNRALAGAAPAAGYEAYPSLEEALDAAYRTDSAPRVIGGAEIYARALPLATTVLLTEIDRDVDGDCTMPAFDASVWEEVERRGGESAGVAFVTLKRRTVR